MATNSKTRLLIPLIICAATSSQAAEFTGYGVLTTDYVFRGVSYSDSHVAVQLGGEILFDGGMYFGAWASTVDLSGGPGIQRDLEVDYYAGYGFDVSSRWHVVANIVSYNFPDTKGPFEYDYFEYSLSGNYNDRLWLEYAYSPNLFHTDQDTHNYELYSEWPIAMEMTIGAGVGIYDVSNVSGSDYSYWQIGVTRPAGLADFDLRYFDTSGWVPLISMPDQADERIVLSIRFQF